MTGQAQRLDRQRPGVAELLALGRADELPGVERLRLFAGRHALFQSGLGFGLPLIGHAGGILRRARLANTDRTLRAFYADCLLQPTPRFQDQRKEYGHVHGKFFTATKGG